MILISSSNSSIKGTVLKFWLYFNFISFSFRPTTGHVKHYVRNLEENLFCTLIMAQFSATI